MIKEKFKNKLIACMGASNTQGGEWVYSMRSFIKSQEDKCYFLTRGIAGNRASLAKYMIDEDVFCDKPDYVIISFGANDLGIWLYDEEAGETPEILAEREKRNKEHLESIKEMFDRAKARGITPIYSTAAAMNERLVEEEDIKTVGDNEEKAKLIKQNFYKQNNFKRINKGLRALADIMKEFCAENGYDFIDVLEGTRQDMLVKDGMYQEDGIHMTEKGHASTAKVILKFLGYDVPDDLPSERYADLDELQNIERQYCTSQFFLRPTYVPFGTPDVDRESFREREEKVSDIYLHPEGKAAYAVNYAKYAYGNLRRTRELREIIKEKAVKV